MCVCVCVFVFVCVCVCVHKSDTNTGKKRCGAAKQFLECCSIDGKFDNFKMQLIEFVYIPGNL